MNDLGLIGVDKKWSLLLFNLRVNLLVIRWVFVCWKFSWKKSMLVRVREKHYKPTKD